MICRTYPLLILFTIALTLTLTHALLSPQPCQQSRPYTNHTFLGAHDAPFVGALPQQNQNLNVTAQLDLGIRFLQAQTHRSIDDPDTRLQLCHTSCLLEDAGSLEDFLRLVKGWLLVEGQGHEREVVTLLLTNGDNVDVGLFARAFKGSGVDEMVYVPETNGLQGWPSIEEIVDMGKRVVVFLGMYTHLLFFEGHRACQLMIRLRRQHHQNPLHPRRIHLLFRNALRRDRRVLLQLLH